MLIKQVKFSRAKADQDIIDAFREMNGKEPLFEKNRQLIVHPIKMKNANKNKAKQYSRQYSIAYERSRKVKEVVK